MRMLNLGQKHEGIINSRAMDSVQVTHEEYTVFHAMDRALYSILAVELWRNPHESVQTVALWVWLERLGFKNVIQKILSLPRILINELADEALVCYRCIKDPKFLYSAKATDIPLTHGILKKKISLQFFHENRDTAIDGIRNVVAEVCAMALADVIREAIKRHSAQKPVKKKKSISPAVDQSLVQSFANLGFVSEMSKGNTNGKRVAPATEPSLVHNLANMGFAGEIPQGSPHGNEVPLALEQSSGHSFANSGLGGSSNGSTPANMVPPALQRSLDHIFASMGLRGQMSSGVAGNGACPVLAWSLGHSFGNLGLRGEISDGVPPADEQSFGHNFANLGLGAEMSSGSSAGNGSVPENRTLFVTFSKGYPMTEAEVREFFTHLFGECIESFYMQPVMPHEQALYARVVFCKPDIIDLVLNGLQKAKYTVNGKHLWMRKFVPKRASSSSSQPPEP